MTETAGVWERTVTVKKMRSIATAPVRYRFTMQKDQGIVLDLPGSMATASSATSPMFEYFDPSKLQN
jgi:KaiC/GvpD/RAD55 family RecA-like ATPase